MRWLALVAVVFVSVVITTLAIDAADTMSGVRGTLLGQLVATDTSECPAGMIAVPAAQTFRCIDQYEAAASSECPYTEPKNNQETAENIANKSCTSQSAAGVMPWRFVTRDQAVTMCLQSGKRLITSSEWFLAAAGTPDNGACNTDASGAQPSGSSAECVSAVGVADTIGNVWEWTADDVIAGTYQGRPVPSGGYIAQVDASGFPTMTSGEASALFFEDYFWSASDGAFGVLRGGFFGSKSDAGVYTVHAQTPPTNASIAIGFRCVI